MKLLKLQAQIVKKMIRHEMINEHNHKRASKELNEDVLKQMIGGMRRKMQWEAHVAKFPLATTEEEAMMLKEELSQFVICPIDKHGAKGMIM